MKDEGFTEMKHAYDDIPIPRELSFRVTDSIERAKKELENTSKKLSRVTFFRNTFGRASAILVTAMLAITVMVNSNESIAYAIEDIPLLGSIARVVTFREYTHSQNNMTAIVKVPSVSVERNDGTLMKEPTAELNRQIQEYTDQIIAAYEKDVDASNGVGHENLDLSYTIVTDNDRLFTLRFDQSVVMAGSMHSVKIYNLDKTTGRLITLKDLFLEDSDYVKILSAYIKEQMEKQMQENADISYFLGTDSPGLDFTEIDAEENFYISEAGVLTLVFDKYEVAPGYMGSVEFEIPKEVIAGIIKDGYLK